MKKKIWKLGVSGLVMVGLFVTGVYAGSNLVQISAYLNQGVTLSWNGVPFYPTEDDGTRVYPITYNGRTYIPAKYIAEKANLDLTWNGETNTVAFADENYIPSIPTKGTYKKIGNGTISFLTDDFESITQYGYNVEETLALTNAGTHTIKMSPIQGGDSERKQITIQYVKNMRSVTPSNGWNLTSSTDIGGGHYKDIYIGKEQPLIFEIYSTNSDIIMSARRTDMGNNSVQTIVSNSNSYFEGYFSSVPKPRLDSSWSEEVTSPLTDWSTNYSENAYTMTTYFRADKSKLDSAFEKYKNDLINSGFKFYEEEYDHYTYIKGDIAITIFAGFDEMSVRLESGYQAPHI